MRQLTLKTPSVRILACAPSNSAADLLAERLARAGLNERELFRLNAPSRSVEQLPVFLKSYSKTNTAGTFCVPPKEDLCSFKVVVVTCVSASVPHGIGVPRGHFTHIFVDEAGQASEPEAMIAIKTLADARTNIVLAGDPKQLGPIVHSGAAQALGLQLSLLDRLMARPAYEDDMRGIRYVLSVLSPDQQLTLWSSQFCQAHAELPITPNNSQLPESTILQERARTVWRSGHHSQLSPQPGAGARWHPHRL